MEQNDMNPEIKPKDIERFKSKIVKADNGCELWTGCKAVTGTGMIMVRGKTYTSNRFMIEHVLEQPLQPEQRVVNTCKNRLCCNPDHLAVVSRSSACKMSYLDNPFYKKLTDNQVAEIKQRYKRYCRLNGVAELARRYNVSESTIENVLKMRQ